MRRIVLAAFCLHLATAGCPSGLTLIRNGQCRGPVALGVTNVIDNEVHNEALKRCGGIGAKPVAIHTQEEQDYWSSFAMKSGHYIPIGIECNVAVKQWQWSDGSPVDYKPPGSGFYPTSLDGACTTTAAGFEINKAGKWAAVPASGFKYTNDFYCIADLDPQQDMDCLEAGGEDDGKQQCYSIPSATGNWAAAQNLCASYGAKVASVHSDQVNSFLRRAAVARGFTSGLLLGASRPSKTADFAWVDKSKWDYDNFVNGFPASGSGDCLVMRTDDVSGQWVNAECSTKLPTVCEAKVSECSADKPFATAGEVVTTPGFPLDASSSCEMYLQVAAGYKVEVTIDQLEANTCCDHLVLYEGSIGGTIIANLTGELSGKTYRTKSTNLMRASWQPTDGRNVRGAMLTFKAV